MAIVNNVNEVLHRVRTRLYHNYLPGGEGAYIARTDDEASLDIEAICAALKNRGGFTGNYDELVAYVKQFYQEMIYQLCDGFSVNTGFYSIHLKIGGSWQAGEVFDPEKHRLSITFRPRLPLRDALSHIEVLNEGVADTPAFIVEVTDADTGLVNETLSPNEDFIITGHRIKITKGEAGCGLFVRGPLTGGGAPAGVEVEIPKYTENTASKVIARAPAQLAPGDYRLVIKTRYSGNTLLKEVRVIESPFTLKVSGAAP